MDLDNLGGPGEVPNISDITLERDQQGDKEGAFAFVHCMWSNQ